MKKCLLLITIILLLSACTPSANTIQTAIAHTQAAIAQTQTSAPTSTDAFTRTPSRTATQVHTRTPSRTATLLYSLTPSLTGTPTTTFTNTNTPTASLTPTATSTPTETNTPTASLTPTATINILTISRGDGYYLVGVEIAPGNWRNDSTDAHCNWVTTSRMGTIINEYFGAGGGTAYISPNSFAFESKRCGTWTFLAEP